MAPKALFPTIFVLFHPIANLFLPNALAAGKNPGNKGSSEIGGGQGSSPNKNNAETTAGGDKNKSEGLQESKDQQSSSPPSPKTKIKNNSQGPSDPNIGHLEQSPLFSGKGNVQQQEANLPKKGKEELKKDKQIQNEDKQAEPSPSSGTRKPGPPPLGNKEIPIQLFSINENVQQQQQANLREKGKEESKIRDPKRGDDKNKDKGKLPASSHSSQAVPGSIGPNIGNLEQGPLFSREGNVQQQQQANLREKGKEVSKTSETKHGKDEDKDKDKKQRDDDKNNNGGTPPASSGASKKAK